MRGRNQNINETEAKILCMKPKLCFQVIRIHGHTKADIEGQHQVIVFRTSLDTDAGQRTG